jgi:hypothetical protein
LITHGPQGLFFEVDRDGTTVWEYVNPVAAGQRLVQGMAVPSTNFAQENWVFLAERYGRDYPGLAGRDLVPGARLELDPESTAVTTASSGLAGRFSLAPNYPNPFNPSTQIPYNLSTDGPVLLRIYNAQGQVVRHLVHGHRTAGSHQVYWNSLDDAGRSLASGVYHYELAVAGKLLSRPMLLLR